MSIELEKDDLIITEAWDGTMVEICVFVGATGFLMYNMSTRYFPLIERYIKKRDSLPYSQTIVCKSSPDYNKALMKATGLPVEETINDLKES